jgi:hypothetical protein
MPVYESRATAYAPNRSLHAGDFRLSGRSIRRAYVTPRESMLCRCTAHSVASAISSRTNCSMSYSDVLALAKRDWARVGLEEKHHGPR